MVINLTFDIDVKEKHIPLKHMNYRVLPFSILDEYSGSIMSAVYN